MSNVSIYEKNWTDLVFEDKNKAYGAYQLRQENPRTSLLAFIIGIVFIFSLIGFWLLLSSFGEKPAVLSFENEETIITLSDFNLPKNEEPEKEKAIAPLKKEETKKDIEKKDLKNVTLVKPEDNLDVIKTNKELKENPSDTNANATSTTGLTLTTSGSTTGTSTISNNNGRDENKTITTNLLDRLPEYPGGIKKFYEYVGNSIEKSEIENSSSSVSVIMAFVIEKDGSMTDIRVLRSSDKALEKEAIRVLRAIKIKWSPGYLDGEKVRTLYTLPIKVAF
ncbi:energy transducer TonB [Flavobacterium sp.]|jgi:protein TonB|uniref:energy transducer TonB n=1 Tax=Flavobacterium sp. TaxID=239 RepID=UPI0037C03457